MKKLLADFFPNDKERQDFFIALVVIAFFVIGILSYILPQRNSVDATLLTAKEIDEKVKELEYQQLSFDEGIVTDIEGYRPYYDHQQKDVVYDNRQIKTDLTATAAVVPPIVETIETHKADVVEDNNDNQIIEEEADTQIIPETEILIEEDFDDTAIQEEVPPELDEEGNVIENEVEDTEVYDMEADAAAIEAEREQERLAAEAAAQERKEKLARAAAKRKAAERAKRNAIGTLDGCHIIVGAFKNKKNARSFKEKVAAQNFLVNIGSVRGKMYVGIPITCTDKDKIKATQQRVNDVFKISSWVLRN